MKWLCHFPSCTTNCIENASLHRVRWIWRSLHLTLVATICRTKPEMSQSPHFVEVFNGKNRACGCLLLQLLRRRIWIHDHHPLEGADSSEGKTRISCSLEGYTRGCCHWVGSKELNREEVVLVTLVLDDSLRIARGPMSKKYSWITDFIFTAYFTTRKTCMTHDTQ